MGDFNTVLKDVGEFGPYQQRIFVIACLVCISVTMQTCGMLYWAATPSYVCHRARTATIHERKDICLATVGCEDILLSDDPDVDETRASEDALHHLPHNLSISRWDISLSESYTPCILRHHISLNFHCNNSASTLQPESNSGTIIRKNVTTLECHTAEHCASWSFAKEEGETIVTKWSLVCTRELYVWMLYCLEGLSRSAGAMMFGYFADKSGRRKSLVVCAILQALLAVVCSFSPQLDIFFVLRSIVSFFTGGLLVTSGLMVVEPVGDGWRVFLVTIFFAIKVCSSMILGFLAYFIRDQHELQLTTSLPLTTICIVIWLLPESPRWLLTHNKFSKLSTQLQTMKDTNCKDVDNMQINAMIPDESNEDRPFDIITTPLVKTGTFIIMFIWFVIGMTYFSISVEFPIKPLAQNIKFEFNPMLTGFIEIVLYGMICCASCRYGRRPLLCLTLVLAGGALSCTAPLPPELYFIHEILILAAKCIISSSMCITWFYTLELLPTVSRGTGLSLSVAAVNTSRLIAVYVDYLGRLHPNLPCIALATLCLLAALGVLFLPETRHQPLPEVISDVIKRSKCQATVLGLLRIAPSTDADGRRVSTALGDDKDRRNSIRPQAPPSPTPGFIACMMVRAYSPLSRRASDNPTITAERSNHLCVNRTRSII